MGQCACLAERSGVCCDTKRSGENQAFNLSDPWAASGTRFYGSAGHIQPVGHIFNTAEIKELNLKKCSHSDSTTVT